MCVYQTVDSWCQVGQAHGGILFHYTSYPSELTAVYVIIVGMPFKPEMLLILV